MRGHDDGREGVDRLVWIDGRLVPWADATVHLMSHSLQRGSLVFDYLSVHETPEGPAIFRLPEHAERLLRSCELVGLPLRRDADDLMAAICETVRANPGATAVKASAYLASIEVDVVALDDRVTLAIAAYDPTADIQRQKAAKPHVARRLRLWIEKEKHNRRDDIVSPQAKVSANYASTMMAKAKARAAGYDEILLVDEEGMVAEGPTTNVFLVDSEGRLRTPPSRHVLLGVTRSSIIEIARHDGIEVLEESITPEELLAASEVFLTGTTAGVWPVASIDGEPVGNRGGDEIGPVSRALRRHFLQITAGEDPVFKHWLTPVQSC